MEEEKANNFIQERLNSLNVIDTQIVLLLLKMSDIFETYSVGPTGDVTNTKKSFEGKTSEIYKIISNVAIDLRKEVKLMDENIGVYDRNEDGVMILPIDVNQKNTKLGENKMNDELSLLGELLQKERDNEREDNSGVKKEEADNIEPSDNVRDDNDVEMTY